MTRDQIIADLVLHGYALYADIHGWVAIWNGETGRMCKYFYDGLDGPGWDVRGPLQSFLSLSNKVEVPWDRINDEQLRVLTAPEIPPKYRHNLSKTAMQALVDSRMYENFK